jgi:transposase
MKQASAWPDADSAGEAAEISKEASPRQAGAGRPRFKPVERGQSVFRTVVIEELIEADHPARAVWEFTGKLDLSAYCAPVKAVEGVAGREPWNVRLLISLWIYAYSRGIGSAREVARRCEYDPAFQWLTGLEKINYHTLAEFRVRHAAALDELFTQTLGVLSAEGLVSLERVMHDGTKIRAFAGVDSFRREERIEAFLKAAREQVSAMGDPREDTTARQNAARERAKRERVERLEAALAELEKLRSDKADAEEKAHARASVTEPQARMMKQGDGGYAPSYNVQLSTEASNRCVVGVGLSQSGSDYRELPAAVERVEEQAGKRPGQVVVDGGFTSRENIEQLAGAGVDLIGSMADRSAQTEAQMRRRGVDEAFYPSAFTYDAKEDCFVCPAGKALRRAGGEKRRGVIQREYRASGADCSACAWKERCCPGTAAKGRAIRRAEESPPVCAFIEKMQTDAAKAAYRQRGAIAEFPNAWIKERIGLRKFRVRGMAKALCETLWASLAYNIAQWIRLRWRVRSATAA